MKKSILLYSDCSLRKNPRGSDLTDIAALDALFTQNGFETQKADGVTLADKLEQGFFQIALIDSACAFPASAVEPLKRYLRRGGKLITTGGYAFYDIVSEVLEPDGRRCISVSSDTPTSACWTLTLDEDSEDLGAPMANIFEVGKGFSNLDAGETMVVKFFMKSEGVSEGMVGLTVSCYHDEKLLAARTFTASGEGWQYVFGRMRAPLSVNRIVISAGLNGSAGKVSFDDLHIGIDHYTQVYACSFEQTEGWKEEGEGHFFIEPRQKEYYLSSAFADGVEDDAVFRQDSVPLFDLEGTIENATQIVAAPGQCLFSSDINLSGNFEGWSAISPVGEDVARWQPLLICKDDAGVERGYAAALLRCFPTRTRKIRRNRCYADYAGLSVAFFGITNVDLFVEPAIAQGLIATALALLDKPYFKEVVNEYDCYRIGEQATIHGRVTDITNVSAIRLTLCDENGGEIEQARIPASLAFDHTFTYADYSDDFYTLRSELLDADGVVLDCFLSGFVVWQEATVQKGLRLNLHDNLYYVNHGPGTPEKAVFGTGIDDIVGRVRMPLIGPLGMRREFIQRRDLGLLVYETLDNVRWYPKDPVEREKYMRIHDATIALCCKYEQLYMMGLAIGDNVACTDETIAESVVGIRYAVGRYRDCHNIIYYLNGDFSCRLDERTIPVLQPVFTDYLHERYPDDETLATAWKEPGLTRDTARLEANWSDGRDYTDQKAQDYNFFRYYLQNRWIGPLAEAVHSVDPTQPCTSEYYETPKFTVDLPRAINDHDIANIGCFCHFSEFSQRLAYADQRYQNKGFGIGEYGKRGHELYQLTDCEYMRYFPQEEVKDTTVHYMNGAYAMGANHCHVWCGIDFISNNFPWGLVRSDNAPRDLAYWVRNFNLMAHQNEAVYQGAPVAIITPDNTRSRASLKYQTGHYAATKAIATLQHVADRIMTLNECNLVIPDSVRVIFYPVAIDVPEAVLDALKDWVAKGGTLYVSGDISGDGDFYGRSAAGSLIADRLESFLSLTCEKRMPITLRYPKKPVTYTIRDDRGSFTRVGAPSMCLRATDEKAVRVLGADTEGNAVLFASSYGEGTVIFNSDPCEALFCSETLAADKRLYQLVLSTAGVASAQILSDVEDIKVFSLPLADGGRVVNLANCDEGAGNVTFAGKYRLTQNPLRSQMLRENSEGELTGALFEGELAVGGKAFAKNGAYAYVLSCDNRALSVSKRLLILPQQPGTIRLACEDTGDLVLIRGQIHEGSFRRISGEKIDHAAFEVSSGARNDLFLLCKAGDEESFMEAVTKQLIMQVANTK